MEIISSITCSCFISILLLNIVNRSRIQTEEVTQHESVRLFVGPIRPSVCLRHHAAVLDESLKSVKDAIAVSIASVTGS